MNILHSIRSTIIAAFFSLPLLFISYTAFLAVGLGTPALFILLLGQLLLSVATFVWHIAVSFIPFLQSSKELFTVEATRAALLQGKAPEIPIIVFPSYWMTHVVFFLSYLLANAVDVFKTDPDFNASDWQVSNRRSKAVAVIIVVVLVMAALLAARYILTGTETRLGALISLLSIPIGFGWYELAKTCGARESDIFGIVQQMTPNGGAPTTCVYTPIA